MSLDENCDQSSDSVQQSAGDISSQIEQKDDIAPQAHQIDVANDLSTSEPKKTAAVFNPKDAVLDPKHAYTFGKRRRIASLSSSFDN